MYEYHVWNSNNNELVKTMEETTTFTTTGNTASKITLKPEYYFDQNGYGLKYSDNSGFNWNQQNDFAAGSPVYPLFPTPAPTPAPVKPKFIPTRETQPKYRRILLED